MFQPEFLPPSLPDFNPFSKNNKLEELGLGRILVNCDIKNCFNLSFLLLPIEAKVWEFLEWVEGELRFLLRPLEEKSDSKGRSWSRPRLTWPFRWIKPEKTSNIHFQLKIVFKLVFYWPFCWTNSWINPF